jgi:hypothetical protein
MAAASLILAAVIAFGTMNSVVAHKYYAALTMIDYNPRSTSFEIVHRFFAHDIERALSAEAGEDVLWDNPEKLEPLLQDLLEEKFTFTIDGAKTPKPTYVGFEVEGQLMFVYQKVPYAGNRPTGFTIASAMLMGFFDDQVNTVNLTWGGSKLSDTFLADDAEKKLVFK